MKELGIVYDMVSLCNDPFKLLNCYESRITENTYTKHVIVHRKRQDNKCKATAEQLFVRIPCTTTRSMAIINCDTHKQVCKQHSVPEDVAQVIVDNLLSDKCPMYDPSHDVVSACLAFGHPIPRAHQRAVNSADDLEFPPKYHYHEMQSAIIKCPHVIWTLKNRKAVDAREVRRKVMHAHDNDPVKWLACWISKTTKTRPPDWFLRMWLPIKSPSRKQGFLDWTTAFPHRIADAWNAVAEGPSLSRDVLQTLIKESWKDHETTRKNFDSDIIDASGNSDARVDYIAQRCLGHLEHLARRFCDIGHPCNEGSIRRARTTFGAVDWIPERMMVECISYISSGIPADLPSRLLEPAALLEAAREMAIEHGVDPDVADTAVSRGWRPIQAVQDEIEFVKLKEEYASLGLEITDGQGTYVDAARDPINNIGTSELQHFHELIYPYNRCHELFQPSAESLRAMIDAYVELRDALAARGLELREDSRLCAEYIIDGDGDIEEIVDMMEEMSFLFQKTMYGSCMRALRDSELSKLAAMHKYIVIDGRPVDDLTPRLKKLYDSSGSAEKMSDAWEDYQEESERMQEFCFGRWCDDCTDSCDDSDDCW